MATNETSVEAETPFEDYTSESSTEVQKTKKRKLADSIWEAIDGCLGTDPKFDYYMIPATTQQQRDIVFQSAIS
jgi:hypothetical protein